MATVRWTLTALEDIQEIEKHIARDSPVHAIHMTSSIIEATDNLAQYPQMGRMVPEFEREDLRELIYRSYRIIYRFRNDAATILRVVHGARDLFRVAEQEPWDSLQ